MMIRNDIIIKLKGCTKKQRLEIKNILLINYMNLLDDIVKEADYCSVDSYWKDYTPIGKPIISAKKFISRNKKQL
jgi:hypothetical protein